MGGLMPDNITTIGEATFYVRTPKGRDARNLIRIDTETGKWSSEGLFDHLTIGALVDRIELREKIITNVNEILDYVGEMEMTAFLQLVTTIAQTFSLSVETVKNSESSPASRKTRKGGGNTIAPDVKV
jgi:nucleoside-triphosphatase THEP1